MVDSTRDSREGLDRPLRPMQAGPQPLDEILARHGLRNHDIVEASGGALTHKVVQKGRTGRRLTRRTQIRIAGALRACLPGETFELTDLFTYRGR
jgi:hypothetical protein